MHLETQLLAGVLSVELTLFAVAAVVYLAHGMWLSATRARRTERVVAAREALMLALAAPEGHLAEHQSLRALPKPIQFEVLAELAQSLGGTMNERIGEAADALGLTVRAERRCGSPLWWRRLQAVQQLALVGRGDRVVPPLLADRDAHVRAAAAAWSSDHPEPPTLVALMGLLESDRGSRFAVQDALLRLGDRAVPPVAGYLRVNDGEVVLPALRIAVGLASPTFMAPALRLAGDPSPRVRSAAADLLGAVGGEEAVGALVLLLADPIAPVRGAAARALARLDHWPAAARLADLLLDQDWAVRRDAALALRGLGPTGEMLLMQAARADIAPAAQIARLTLAAPAPA